MIKKQFIISVIVFLINSTIMADDFKKIETKYGEITINKLNNESAFREYSIYFQRIGFDKKLFAECSSEFADLEVTSYTYNNSCKNQYFLLKTLAGGNACDDNYQFYVIEINDKHEKIFELPFRCLNNSDLSDEIIDDEYIIKSNPTTYREGIFVAIKNSTLITTILSKIPKKITKKENKTITGKLFEETHATGYKPYIECKDKVYIVNNDRSNKIEYLKKLNDAVIADLLLTHYDDESETIECLSINRVEDIENEKIDYFCTDLIAQIMKYLETIEIQNKLHTTNKNLYPKKIIQNTIALIKNNFNDYNNYKKQNITNIYLLKPNFIKIFIDKLDFLFGYSQNRVILYNFNNENQRKIIKQRVLTEIKSNWIKKITTKIKK